MASKYTGVFTRQLRSPTFFGEWPDQDLYMGQRGSGSFHTATSLGCQLVNWTSSINEWAPWEPPFIIVPDAYDVKSLFCKV